MFWKSKFKRLYQVFHFTPPQPLTGTFNYQSMFNIFLKVNHQNCLNLVCYPIFLLRRKCPKHMKRSKTTVCGLALCFLTPRCHFQFMRTCIFIILKVSMKTNLCAFYKCNEGLWVPDVNKYEKISLLGQKKFSPIPRFWKYNF